MRKSFWVTAIICLCTYLVFETVVSVLYMADVIERPASIWLFEDSGRTVHFDGIRGYRLTEVPSRITRITRGNVEYVGALKGNNQGFPDRDDFYPERAPNRCKRFAVFGDSYTAAQFLAENWPDTVEDLTRSSSTPLELLNFSTDGGGLANWWSVLTRLVERDGYQIDGVIFAVIPGDLWRRFSVADHQGQDRPMFGRVPAWDPEAIPATLESARKYLRPQTSNAYIVSTEEFDRGLRGDWRPSSKKTVRPYFAWMVWRAVRGKSRSVPETLPSPKAFDSLDPGQEWMIEDMARAVESMNAPVMVIHVPSREELLEGRAGAAVDARLFADLLGGRVVDGTQAFRGRSAEEIRALWLPYDAHWGQTGSNDFAKYMAGVLTDWSRIPGTDQRVGSPPTH